MGTADAGGKSQRILYVGGLSEEVTDLVLRQAFEPFGIVKEAKVKLDRDGKTRAFGFVEFEEEQDLEAAQDNMHESELFGRTLTVNRSKSLATGGGGNPMHRPVWADDFLHRRELESAGLAMN